MTKRYTIRFYLENSEDYSALLDTMYDFGATNIEFIEAEELETAGD